MGSVILPNGTSINVVELSGSINLSTLVIDMANADYSHTYRVSMIDALVRLNGAAISAIPYLKKLAERKETSEDKLIAQAAEKAITVIQNASPHRTEKQSYGSGYGSGVSSGFSKPKKVEMNKVNFEEVDSEELHEGLRYYCKCNFCEKITFVNPSQNKYSDWLAGSDKYYCNFCLRNDYYQKYGKNVMVLTYRGIIGYYFYSFYVVPKNSSMYPTEIQDFTELHIKVGLTNPLFRYDPESFCWFIDFNKVGKKKVPVDMVLSTIIQQLSVFNLYENVRECSPKKLFEKYRNAVDDFYKHKRASEKIFCPTLWGCGIPTISTAEARAIPLEVIQNFMPNHLYDINYNNRQNKSRLW